MKYCAFENFPGECGGQLLQHLMLIKKITHLRIVRAGERSAVYQEVT